MTEQQQAKTIERILKLLRLATNNPSEEEARTAAMQAAKLITESGCVVGFTRASQPPPPQPFAPQPFADDLGERIRQAQAAMQNDRMRQWWQDAQQHERQPQATNGQGPGFTQNFTWEWFQQ